MNRKQFQEWLEQFPEETIIEVGVQNSPPDYCPYGAVYFQEFVGGEIEPYTDDYEVLDFRDNQFVKESNKHFGKVYLQLGVRT